MTKYKLSRGAIAASTAALLSCGAFAATADAHTRAHWDNGYYGTNAVVTGTVGTVSGTSFTAEAYVVTPGAGDSGTPTETQVTITEGSGTKVVTEGQSGITTGDSFYAIYPSATSSETLAQITGGTPSKVIAFNAPTPEVEVQGVVTAAPTAAEPDEFTATASVVTPTGNKPQGGNGGQSGNSGKGGYGSFGSQSGTYGGSYSYGRGVSGNYGYFDGSSSRGHAKTRCEPAGDYSQGTADTTILTSDSTTFDINGSTSSTVSNIGVGDKFTAIYSGTPGETLSQIVTSPAVSVDATAPKAYLSFVGTVVSTDTTTSPETVTVDVSNSNPSGLFSGDQTFDVGQRTLILGGDSTNGWLGSLSGVSTGDTVTGGLVGYTGESATDAEATPLAMLDDFPATTTTSSSSSSSTTQGSSVKLRSEKFRKAALKRAERELRGKI